MNSKLFIRVTIGVFLTLNMFCSGGEAIEIKTFSSQEIEDIRMEVDTMGGKEVFSMLYMLHALRDPTLKKGELETFVSIADMQRIDLNGDGKKDFAALLNYRGTSDPVELFLLYSVENGVVVQTFPTERAMMNTTVLDLDGDGIYEICLNESILGNTPHVLVVYWVNVYSWNGQTYVKSNEQAFESFYMHRYLPQISERLHDLEKRLDWGESRKTILSVLEDCRTALEKISSMSTTETFQKHLPTLRETVDLESVRNNLSSISSQLVRTQELLRQNAQNEEITSVLQASQKLLQQMSRTSD